MGTESKHTWQILLVPIRICRRDIDPKFEEWEIVKLIKLNGTNFKGEAFAYLLLKYLIYFLNILDSW